MADSPLYTVNDVVAALDALDGQLIRVAGVLRLEFEGDSLWHYPANERHPGYHSSLWAGLDYAALGLAREELRRFHCRRVVVSAVVDREFTGHMGLWPGALLIRGVVKSRSEGV